MPCAGCKHCNFTNIGASVAENKRHCLALAKPKMNKPKTLSCICSTALAGLVAISTAAKLEHRTHSHAGRQLHPSWGANGRLTGHFRGPMTDSFDDQYWAEQTHSKSQNLAPAFSPSCRQVLAQLTSSLHLQAACVRQSCTCGYCCQHHSLACSSGLYLQAACGAGLRLLASMPPPHHSLACSSDL